MDIRDNHMRQSGIDLLRCLGLLFVVGVHSFLYNGYYGEKQVGLLILPANSFRWLFFCCNGLFMMITGYLKTEKPFSRKYYASLLPILVSYTLICVITFPIRQFGLHEEKSLTEWLRVWYGFGNYAWYLEMYIGLLLLSPAINFTLDGLKTKKNMLSFVGIMAFLTAFPSMVGLGIMPDYWIALYPFTYYSIGACIRRCKPKVHPLVGLGGAGTVVLFLGLMTLLTTDGTVSDGFSQGYGGFWITAIATFLFLGLYDLKITGWPAKMLAIAANGVFEGYILSRLVDVWAYGKFPQWHQPGKYWILFLCVTVPNFLYALTAGNCVHFLTKKLLSVIPKRKAKV